VRSHRTRAFNVAALACGVMLVLFTGWLSTGGHAARTDAAVSDAAFVLTPAFAAITCLFGARRDVANRRAWLLLSLAFAFWTAASVYWGYHGVVLEKQLGVPSLADLGYVGYAVPAVLGLSAFESVRPQLATRMRMWLDGLGTCVGLLFVSWVVVLNDMVSLPASSWTAWVASIAYPVADISVASVVLVRGMRAPAGARLQWVLLGSGLLFLSVTDSVYVALTAAGNFRPGTVLDVGWAGAFLLGGLAALAPSASEGRATVQRLSLLQESLPYLPIPVALVVLASHPATSFTPTSVATWLGIALFALVVARYLVTTRDHLALATELEQLVEARTSELELRDDRFRSLVQHSADVILVVDPAGHIGYQSPALQAVLGHQDLTGKPWLDLVHPADVHRVGREQGRLARGSSSSTVLETRMRHADGHWCDVEVCLADLLGDPAVVGFVLNLRDVSERTRLGAELRHLAYHDPLTGTPNRVAFLERLDTRLAIRRGPFAVLFIDLDGFKAVNDGLGHAAGDHLLRDVATRLAARLRPADVIARLGGDEFGVLLDTLPADGPGPVAQRLLDGLVEPFDLLGRSMSVRASIGIVQLDGRPLSGAPTPDPSDLLRNADLAMYLAKSRGGSGFEFYDQAMHAVSVTRLELAGDLRHALERDEFFLAYQPIVRLKPGTFAGAEALLRWQHPTRGLIPPDDFIALAEETGLIIPIGLWVLEEACRELRRWQDAHTGAEPLGVAVNVSGRQLGAPLVEAVRRVLETYDLDPGTLTLEVTESVITQDLAAARETLGQLKALGVWLAIDDFGTGHSSLGRLRDYDFDELKIDRTFVCDIDSGETQLVTAQMALAHGMGMQVVAEGVETETQLRFLREHGCGQAQGYLLGRPMPAQDVRVLMAGSATLEECSYAS
jgi:diguanylate cyclase (GGDEF)-like protein/PAS domain S-box-containing protein